MWAAEVAEEAVVSSFFFFSSRRRHTRCLSDWSSDVCSSDLPRVEKGQRALENQVSRTSVSWLRLRDAQRGQRSGVSRATTISKHWAQCQAGMRWPHQSWREMHQSRMLYIHSK